MYPEAAIGFSLPLEAYDYLPSSVVGPPSLIRRPSVVVRVYFFGFSRPSVVRRRCWLVGVKFYLVVSVCFKDFRVAAQNVHCRSNPRSFMFPRCARVSAACADPLSLGVGKGYMAGLSNHTACRSILFVISSYSLFWLLYA
jgi:hypothetical protein